MTYRIAFRYLIIVATALAFGMFWCSHLSRWAIWWDGMSRRSSLSVTLHSGSLVAGVKSPEIKGLTNAEADDLPLWDHFKLPRLWSIGTIRAVSHGYEVDTSVEHHSMGNLSVRRMVDRLRRGWRGAGLSSRSYFIRHEVRAPLWLLWLLFLSGAFAVLKWLEQRSGRALEKKSAGRTAEELMQESRRE